MGCMLSMPCLHSTTLHIGVCAYYAHSWGVTLYRVYGSFNGVFEDSIIICLNDYEEGV